MRKQAALLYAALICFLLIPSAVLATTWFSCNGDSFCGSSVAPYWGTIDLASGQGSPSGSTNVWRWKFPAGTPGGEGEGTVWPSAGIPAGAQEMWVQWHWKYSPGFVFHGVNNKQFMFHPSNTLAMGLSGDGLVTFNPQGPSATNYPVNVKTTTFYADTGKWHKYKGRYVLNTGNKPNGIYQAWVDDVMIANYSNVYYQNGTSEITSPAFVIIWGGMGGTVPADQYFYVSGIYLGSTDPGGGTSTTKAPMPPNKLAVE